MFGILWVTRQNTRCTDEKWRTRITRDARSKIVENQAHVFRERPLLLMLPISGKKKRMTNRVSKDGSDIRLEGFRYPFMQFGAPGDITGGPVAPRVLPKSRRLQKRYLKWPGIICGHPFSLFFSPCETSRLPHCALKIHA